MPTAALRMTPTYIATTKPCRNVMVRWGMDGYDLTMGTVTKTGRERDLGDGTRIEGHEYELIAMVGTVKFFVADADITSRKVESAVFDLLHALFRAAGLEPYR